MSVAKSTPEHNEALQSTTDIGYSQQKSKSDGAASFDQGVGGSNPSGRTISQRLWCI